jgi:hypothetical protein
LLVDILINANRYIGLGQYVIPIKIALAIMGGFLFIALLIKFKFK